jgi:aspartyl-tRNA(Asn)/glutamyl-tRNA(Gln) amidotransferase subunit A
MKDVLFSASLRELHRALREGKISAGRLAKHAADRHAGRGRHDHAYLTWNGDNAIKAAWAVDELLAAGGDAGPLMGLPVSIKDLYGVPGLPTYAGSSRRLPVKWEAAGPVAAAVLSQVPILMGKTHTVEFAFGGLGTNVHWGTPRNPWDVSRHRVPGGSSSGAGVSIATGSAKFALGTDTAGSVRIPAAMTGVAGLKTTAGRWPTAGIVPLSSTLDTPGLLAGSADDLAFVFAAIDPALCGRCRETIAVPELSDLTFGVPETFFWDDCSPGIAEAVELAIKRLEKAGARMVHLDLPHCDQAYDLFTLGGIAAPELAAFLKTELPDMFDALDPNVAARVKISDAMPAWEYVRRRALLERLAGAAADRIVGVDAMLCPTVAITPPTLKSLEPDGAYAKANMHALRNTVMGNFMGLCATTLPAGKDSAGMPVGLQLMAGPWQDARLLSISRAVESALGQRRELLGELPDPPEDIA